MQELQNNFLIANEIADKENLNVVSDGGVKPSEKEVKTS